VQRNNRRPSKRVFLRKRYFTAEDIRLTDALLREQAESEPTENDQPARAKNGSDAKKGREGPETVDKSAKEHSDTTDAQLNGEANGTETSEGTSKTDNTVGFKPRGAT
jgi:hypothetical protein